MGLDVWLKICKEILLSIKNTPYIEETMLLISDNTHKYKIAGNQIIKNWSLLLLKVLKL